MSWSKSGLSCPLRCSRLRKATLSRVLEKEHGLDWFQQSFLLSVLCSPRIQTYCQYSCADLVEDLRMHGVVISVRRIEMGGRCCVLGRGGVGPTSHQIHCSTDPKIHSSTLPLFHSSIAAGCRLQIAFQSSSIPEFQRCSHFRRADTQLYNQAQYPGSIFRCSLVRRPPVTGSADGSGAKFPWAGDTLWNNQPQAEAAAILPTPTSKYPTSLLLNTFWRSRLPRHSSVYS